MPYLSPRLDGEKLLIGANFASAGIGILNDTGIQFVSEHLFLFVMIILHSGNTQCCSVFCINFILGFVGKYNKNREAVALLCSVPAEAEQVDRPSGGDTAREQRDSFNHAWRQ